MSLARSKPVTGPEAPWYGRAGGPYQATAPFMSLLVAATWYTVDPPQHQPVTPTAVAFTLGRVLAQSTAALQSPRVCSRFWAGTLFRMSWFCATPTPRLTSPGATA